MDNKEIFTSVVRVKGSERYKVIPVKSSAEVEKSKWIQLSKVISRLYVSVPIKKGSIIGFAFDGDNVTKVLIREDNRKMGKPDDNNNLGNAQNSSDNCNSNK